MAASHAVSKVLTFTCPECFEKIFCLRLFAKVEQRFTLALTAGNYQWYLACWFTFHH